MDIQFLGAAQQVTGSQFLITTKSGFRLLVDCGMNMERSTDGEDSASSEGQEFFEFEASMVGAVLLTHAHLDHSGNLPNLYKFGYEGKIFCTEPTAALTEILLFDAASLNRKKLDKINRQKKKGKAVNATGLYFDKQVRQTVSMIHTLRYKQRYELAEGIHVTYYTAGHLLGAAHIVVEIEEEGKTTSIGFSGDLGRKNYPLLVDPEPIPKVDYLVTESTYGDRSHDDEDIEPILEAVLRETCIDQPGRLIIPAFSIGRTQSLLYTLNKIYSSGDFDGIPVFSDSPLGAKSTRIYRQYKNYLSGEARAFAKQNDNLFDFAGLEYVENMKQSEEVSNYSKPCVIVSSSGMIQGGRIEDHISRNLKNSYATILMIGYASEGTFGHKLRNHKGKVSFRGKMIDVACKIKSTDALSGHGDREDLLEFVGYQDPKETKCVFLVHGDPINMKPFAQLLMNDGYKVEIPSKGLKIEL